MERLLKASRLTLGAISTHANRRSRKFALSLRLFRGVLSAMGIYVRRDSAVKLIDDLAGESPASADYSVGTVVISGDGAGDQTVKARM